MNTKEIEIGLRYRVSGDLANGRYADGTPRISHDDVVRVIKQEWFYTIYQMKVLKQLWNQIRVVH